MSLPTIRQLEYFATAARVGTLAAAAAAHHIAQPSLSEQIGALERSVRVKLFTRTSRGLLLTEAGRQLLPLAQRTLDDAREFSALGRGVAAVEAGTVSFGTFNSAHLYLLTHLIRDFNRYHPHVQVNIVGMNSSDVADAIRAGEIEAGLMQLPVDDSELELTSAPFTDQAVYASLDQSRTARPIDIEELATRPLILSEGRFAFRDPLRVTLNQRAQVAGVQLAPVADVELQVHSLELATQGVGDCLISYHVGKQQFAERGLSWAPLDPPIIEHYAFGRRRGAQVSPATAEFVAMATAILEHLDDDARP